MIAAVLPEPVPGLVIHYSYLWLSEHRLGFEEGRKDRPCAIVLAAVQDGTNKIVTVVPVTHVTPKENEQAIEIPADTKQRLGLDSQRSWIILSEANQFIWPGPDIRPARRGDMSTVSAGLLPTGFFHKVRASFVNALRERRATSISRTQ